jgi:hypothetical protein
MDGKTNFSRVVALLNENISELQGTVIALSTSKAELDEQVNALMAVVKSMLAHDDMTDELKDHLKQSLEANGCLD